MQQGQIVKIQAKQEEDIQLLENIREYYKVHWFLIWFLMKSDLNWLF